MVKSPWFRCFPGNFLLGTLGMRPVLHKAYTRLLMGLYDAGGSLPCDPARLWRLLEVRPQDVERLLAELVALGKISVEDGVIHNLRTDHEIGRNGAHTGEETRQETRQETASKGGTNGSGEPRAAGQLRLSDGKKRSENYARPRDHAHDRTRPRGAPLPEAEAEGRALPLQAESPSLAPSPESLGASSGVPVAKDADTAQVASPGLGGRSLPEPSEAEQAQAIEALRQKASTPLQPSEALLRSRIVSNSPMVDAVRKAKAERDAAKQPVKGSSLFERLNAAKEADRNGNG